MDKTLRNQIEQVIGYNRGLATWLAENMTPEEAAAFEAAGDAAEKLTICQIAKTRIQGGTVPESPSPKPRRTRRKAVRNA